MQMIRSIITLILRCCYVLLVSLVDFNLCGIALYYKTKMIKFRSFVFINVEILKKDQPVSLYCYSSGPLHDRGHNFQKIGIEIIVASFINA